MVDLERRAGLRAVPDNPLSIEAIREKYYGQWVLVRLNTMDERRTSIEGTVIAHGRRGRVHQTLLRIAQTIAGTGEWPDMPYSTFHAGPNLPIAPQQQRSQRP